MLSVLPAEVPSLQTQLLMVFGSVIALDWSDMHATHSREDVPCQTAQKYGQSVNSAGQ